MSDELIIKSCSPTLAGLKTGSLFSCSFTDKDQIKKDVRMLNLQLHRKGIRVIPLKYSMNRVLIYMYRPSQLHKDLAGKKTSEILKTLGYKGSTDERKIIELMNRLRCGETFPHEIGLFLGYPPDDVYGFINNNAKNYKLIGTWKVYGDEKSAKILFDKFTKCTRTYCARFAQGLSLEQLAIAI